MYYLIIQRFNLLTIFGAELESWRSWQVRENLYFIFVHLPYILIIFNVQGNWNVIYFAKYVFWCYTLIGQTGKSIKYKLSFTRRLLPNSSSGQSIVSKVNNWIIKEYMSWLYLYDRWSSNPWVSRNKFDLNCISLTFRFPSPVSLG